MWGNMKRKFIFISLIITLLMMFPFGSYTALAASETVYLGGMSAGFSLKTKGAEVVGTCDVITENGLRSPCKDSGIEVGDRIMSINNAKINSVEDIEENITGKTTVIIDLIHNGENVIKTVQPAKDINGRYKLGVFIRDSISGIGTITYIKNDRFASLGHPVLTDRGELLDIAGGELYNCNITGCIKGERGKAGELRGVFLRTNPIASIDKNSQCGVFGKISDDFDRTKLVEIEIGHAEPGNASIFSTINGGEVKEYSISIIKADNYGANKNFVIKISDNELLDATGGIVQGMSGSPIIQDGKLVGAVTHVFINDPTRGFGIDIDNMINN